MSADSFSTTCPYCKKDGDLQVVQATVIMSAPLHADGFDISESKTVDTRSEFVKCSHCTNAFPLSRITR